MPESASRTVRGQDRARSLLDATLRIIVRDGPAAVTLRTVAVEAGAAHGSVAYYFGTRDDLLRAALEDVAERNVTWLAEAEDRLVAAAGSVESYATTLAQLVEEQLVEDVGMGFSVLELHLAAGRDPNLRPIIRRWGKAYVKASVQALAILGSRDPVADTRLLAEVINGMVLEQLSVPRPTFATTVLRPTLHRLATMIAAGA